jgi:WD40 repeat protein
MDGSNQQLVDVISADEQVDLNLNFFPVRWTDDGRLIYATGMTGIGGYMLFWGFNGMYLFNPLNNSIRTLVDDQERLGICLSSISDDLTKIAIVCGGEGNVRVRSLDSGTETIFPIIEDQALAGAARFSPSGEYLAYVVQRADAMQELGKIVVVPVDGSQPPRVLTTVEDGSFTVEGWVSEDYFLVTQTYMFTSEISVLKLNRDGSEVIHIADGKFMDFIP